MKTRNKTLHLRNKVHHSQMSQRKNTKSETLSRLKQNNQQCKMPQTLNSIFSVDLSVFQNPRSQRAREDTELVSDGLTDGRKKCYTGASVAVQRYRKIAKREPNRTQENKNWSQTPKIWAQKSPAFAGLKNYMLFYCRKGRFRMIVGLFHAVIPLAPIGFLASCHDRLKCINQILFNRTLRCVAAIFRESQFQ